MTDEQRFLLELCKPNVVVTGNEMRHFEAAAACVGNGWLVRIGEKPKIEGFIKSQYTVEYALTPEGCRALEQQRPPT